ncbi:MAG: hypothetical protein KQH59_18470 [Desulfobulbaceae bacterium]|nr:hypothetical protein [Desulfobulbaceae bacterium]
MSNPSLLVTYRAPEVVTPEGPGDGSVWLELEQGPAEERAEDFQSWFASKYGSDWSKFNWAEFMQFFEEYQSQCNGDGEFTAEIRVHKSAVDQPYRLDASRGQWSAERPEAGEEQRTDVVQLSGDSSHTITGQAVARIICAQWEGNVYNGRGETMARNPAISVNGATLSWGEPVTGTLRIVSLLEYDVWYLVISPRTVDGSTVATGEVSVDGSDDDDGGGSGGYGPPICTEAYSEERPDTVYGATVYGIHAGGIERLEVRVPDLKGNCGKGGGGDDDDDEDPAAECYKLKVKYHKCTGKKISEELIRVPCPGQSDES